MSEPTNIIAGDTVAWTKTLEDYPAPTWTLTYRLVKVGKSFEIATTASGADHAVSVLPAVTAAWVPGEYAWVALVTDGTNRYTAATGRLTIQPDPAGAEYDPRSTAKVMLENVEAYLRDPTNLAAASYSIGGRSLSRWSRAELIEERSRLQMEVRGEEAVERMAAGLGNPRRLYVRFDRG